MFASVSSPFSSSALAQSKTETPQTAHTAPSALLKSDNTFTQSPAALKNPFAFPNAQISLPSPATGINAASAAPNPFTGFKAPETEFKAQELATTSTSGQPFSLFQGNNTNVISGSLSEAANRLPTSDSIFASPESPQLSQKTAIPVTTAPAVEKPPAASSPPLTRLPSPKPSEASVLAQSAPTAAQVPGTQTGPITANDSGVSNTRRSVSQTSLAASPPQTLFEALRRPKIFDTTSNAYSSELAASQPPKPLFSVPDPSSASEQQVSVKRHRDATDKGTADRQKRRSSLKGKSSLATSDGHFKRSVHFEEQDEQKRSLAKESQGMAPSQPQVLKKKRALDEQTETQSEEQCPSTKLSKVSTVDEQPQFNFSVYKAENRPMPKLPILEKLEEKLARAKALCEPKPPTPEQLQYIEEARLKRARQVDEDEIALSRARILAEKLRNGPGIFDGWTGPIRQPWHDLNWNPAARILEKYHSRNITPHSHYPLPPRLTLIHTARGYEVAYAPDTPDRPMSRTEQRIRRTGARGLANVPLNFERYKREKEQKAKSKRTNKDAKAEDKDDGEKKNEEELNGFFRSV